MYATASAVNCVHGGGFVSWRLSAGMYLCVRLPYWLLVLDESFQRRIPHSWGRCVHKTFVPIRYFLYPNRYQSGQVSVLIDYRVIKPHIDRCLSLEKMPTGILIVNGGMFGGNLL